MGDTIARIPPEVRTGDPVRAEEYNALRAALLRVEQELAARKLQPSPDIAWRRGSGGTTGHLRRGVGGGGGGGTAGFAWRWNHPFKIVMTGDDVAVLPGQATAGEPAEVNATVVLPSVRQLAGLVDLAPVTISAPVGVWLVAQVGRATIDLTAGAALGVQTHYRRLAYMTCYNVAIELSTAWTDPTDAGDYVAGAAADVAVEYIGGVGVVGGEWVIDQRLKSDFCFPLLAWPEGLISLDGTNDLAEGTDGALLADFS